MTPPTFRFLSGLLGLAASLVLGACQHTGGGSSDTGGVVDYTSPTRNMSSREKAEYAFNNAGTYREDWVASNSGGGIKEKPISTDSPYVQDDDPAPSHNTQSSPPVRKTPFVTMKKPVSETRKTASSSGGSKKNPASRKVASTTGAKKTPGKPGSKPVAKTQAKPAVVKIKPGDTLTSLSRKTGVPVDKIKAYNGLKSTVLRDGKTIKIPAEDQEEVKRPPFYITPRQPAAGALLSLLSWTGNSLPTCWSSPPISEPFFGSESILAGAAAAWRISRWGGRSIPWWAVLASILAAEISAGTFLGVPGEGFRNRNFTYAQLLVGCLVARVVISAVFIPAYYRHNVVSIYEFLDQRFGPRTRRMASAVFLVTRVLASGARLWAPTILAIIIWNVTHPGDPLDTWGMFAVSAFALVLITILTALYTAIGGIKAVIWTDVIQIIVLFCALGFSIWYLLGHIDGGWEGAKKHLTGAHDLKLWEFEGEKPADSLWGKIKSVLETEFTIWAAFFGSLFTTMATHGTDQDMVQRMLTAKNKRQSAAATILSGLADIPITLLVLGIGILLYVYYGIPGNGGELLARAKGKVDSSQVFPYFVVTVMPGGLRGLVIAGVLATTMGSLGTAMNSLATSYVRDFHFRWFGEPKDDAGKVRVVRRATVFFALFLILVGLGTALVKALNPGLGIISIILGSFGYTYGSLLGIFLVALFVPGRGNDQGNLIAMVSGFLGVAYLSGLDKGLASMFGFNGLPRPDWVPALEFPWWIMFGTIITFCIAICFPSSGRTAAQQRADA